MRRGTILGWGLMGLLLQSTAFPPTTAAQQAVASAASSSEASTTSPRWLQTGRISWTSSKTLVQAKQDRLPESAGHPWVSVKDPSIVRFQDRWHLFCSLRKAKQGEGRIRIGYTSFEDWQQAGEARWSVLELTPGYHGAPQIFYFEPQQTWYLIYQAEDASRELRYGPCFSTNSDIADPAGWTLPQPLYRVPPGKKAGLDYWVICDSSHAYLFFTTLDGRMWQARTSIDQFPDRGWSEPKVVLQADIFEASHTYKLNGLDQYLTLVEAQQGSTRRYYKAFVADSLDGAWKALAASPKQPFASPANVLPPDPPWTDSYSHGELIRSGINQRLEVDPQGLRFVFQGASSREYHIGDYGQIPWKLGLLEMRDN
jgi:hypothetical protein